MKNIFLAVLTLMLLCSQQSHSQPCPPYSTLGCGALQVSLPFQLSFDNATPNTILDKNGAGTGFTLALPYSGTRLSQDGTPTNAQVPGYESSKIFLTGGGLQLITNKGIAYLTANNQLNTLCVKVASQARLVLEATLVNPLNGTESQQAGLFFGLNDKTFLKLVISGGKVELRREIADASSSASGTANPDQRITGTIAGMDTKAVRLRLVMNPANQTAEGFYSLDSGATYLSTGVAYPASTLSLQGTGLTDSTAFAGIMATHRNANTAVAYTFDNFSITPQNVPPVFSTTSYTFSLADNVALGTTAGSVTASDPNGDAIRYTITAGNTNGAFAIDSISGTIKIAKLLNHHTQGKYNLTVRASDGRLFSEATVTITVSLGSNPPAVSIVSWGTAASQPYTIFEGQGKVVAGKLYTFGGFDSQKSGFTPTSRAYVYDPVANKWTAIASMPPQNGTTHGGVTHAGFATDGTDIYFAGGYTSNASGTGQKFGTKEVWKYIVAEDRYVRMPDLPVTISAGQLEYLEGKLHFIGGTNSTRKLDLGSHYVLDLDNQTAGWKTLASLPNPRQHAGSAVYEGKIYFIAGQHGHDDTLITQKDVHRYDPATDTWTKMADIPVPPGANGRGHVSSAVTVFGSQIIAIAGEIKHNVSVNLVSAYDPANNVWTDLTPLPSNRFSGVAAVLNGNLYYTGGSKTKTTFKGLPGVQQVISFSLVNADADTVMQTLANNSTLNLDSLPTRNLNIVANTNFPTGGSVVFSLSGAETKPAIESIRPFALFGDDNGDYNAWTPTVGSYTLKATPYTDKNAAGTTGTSYTVKFTVTGQSSLTTLAERVIDDKTKSLTLSVYPNPTRGGRVRIDIQHLGRKEEAKLMLLNMLGQTMESKTIVADDQGAASTFVLSDGKPRPGIYLLQLQTAAGKVESKLVVK